MRISLLVFFYRWIDSILLNTIDSLSFFTSFYVIPVMICDIIGVMYRDDDDAIFISSFFVSFFESDVCLYSRVRACKNLLPARCYVCVR